MSIKSSPTALSEHALELIAARFRVLGELSRLKLLIALHAGPLNVTALVEDTGLSQANASKHLQTLVEAGLLARRKEGLNVVYSIADPTIFDLCDKVCGGVRTHLEKRARVLR